MVTECLYKKTSKFCWVWKWSENNIPDKLHRTNQSVIENVLLRSPNPTKCSGVRSSTDGGRIVIVVIVVIVSSICSSSRGTRGADWCGTLPTWSRRLLDSRSCARTEVGSRPATHTHTETSSRCFSATNRQAHASSDKKILSEGPLWGSSSLMQRFEPARI